MAFKMSNLETPREQLRAKKKKQNGGRGFTFNCFSFINFNKGISIVVYYLVNYFPNDFSPFDEPKLRSFFFFYYF